MTDKLREAAQQALDDDLLTGQALHLIGALMSRGFLPNTLSSAERTTLWDVVKRQLRCVNKEGARAALAQQDAQAVERVGDPVTITRLATLVDEETQRILADSLDLIKQINYMVGIAERGTGKKCPDGERPEVFLLDYVKSLEAALSQQGAQAELQGWKLVPVEPTPEMLQAAHDEICDGGLSTTIWLRATCYRAMLNAAPTPPAQRVELTDEEIEDLARGKSGHSDFARDIIEAYERKNGIK